MSARLLANELKSHNIEAYVDTNRVDGAGPFPDRLLRAIEQCDVFICLAADSTLDSEWVRREIEHAHKLGKPMIPIFQESYKSAPEIADEYIQQMLVQDGVHIFDEKNVHVDATIDELARMIKTTINSRSSSRVSILETSRDNELIDSIDDNEIHADFRAGIYVGTDIRQGRMMVTNTRIKFEGYDDASKTILLKEIETVFTPIHISKGMIIVTKSGEEYKFSVSSRESRANLIRNLVIKMS
jgi:hypothetical protein